MKAEGRKEHLHPSPLPGEEQVLIHILKEFVRIIIVVAEQFIKFFILIGAMRGLSRIFHRNGINGRDDWMAFF